MSETGFDIAILSTYNKCPEKLAQGTTRILGSWILGIIEQNRAYNDLIQ